MTQDQQKQAAAQAALQYISEDAVVGVGTGSTVNFFIEALATIKSRVEATVASSVATAERLKAKGFQVIDLNSAGQVPVYVDGADEINQHLQMIKGGGGALTREKILAAASKQFICIADEKKLVPLLGQKTPLPIEVIPMARSYVAREIVKLGGFPVYRENFVTDNGNIILDIDHLPMTDVVGLEQTLNNIVGVVCNGLFAKRHADVLLLATDQTVRVLKN